MYVSRYALVVVLIFGFSEGFAQTVDQSLSDFFEAQEANKSFSGAVLVAQGDQILFEGAYGYADRSTGTKNTVETRFSLASLGKLFTMIATLELMENGRLKLNDQLTQYVEGIEDARSKQVTVLDLLRHRAGWRHYWNNPNYLKHRLETDSIEDYLRVIRKIPIGFEPGSRSQYSNIGYVLLGAIIEKVTRDDYYEHIHTAVFEPNQMVGSDYALYRKLSSAYARHGADGSRTDLLEMTAAKGTADGGGYSTVRDLHKLANALFRGNLLSEKSKALIVNGFESDRLNKDWRVRIAGGFPGISTVLGYMSEDDLTIVILSNASGISAPNLLDQITRIVRN